jgi:hypothetical protein
MTLILQKAFLDWCRSLQNANSLSGRRKFPLEFQVFCGPAFTKPAGTAKAKGKPEGKCL